MAHASEILTQIAKLGLRYCEIPVTITYTAYSLHKGQKLFDSINVLWDLLMEKIR
jgi:polyprenyl-phospho-N-acetylgalactosaminyl synthase